jgi:glycosyltransferase involved in cell wall biosynthesis
MEMKQGIMVSVLVLTYNQEQWIRQTIECILAQKTDYSYEIIIGEDWSKDGTRRICEEYANKYNNVCLLPQDHNLGLIANWVNCVKHASGKYLMFCAGDDYWHNPNKIQLQVDYMENHLECVACHTDIDELNVLNGTCCRSSKKSHKLVIPQGHIQKEILSGKDHISAVTLCLRKSLVDAYVPLDKYVELQFPREDWPTLLILSAHGEIIFIPESTATYRVGQESITRLSDYEKIRFRLQTDKVMTEYLYSLFPEWGPFNDAVWYDNVVWHQMMMAAYRNNDYRSARRFAKRDVYPSWATYMAYTYISFCLFRWFLLKK